MKIFYLLAAMLLSLPLLAQNTYTAPAFGDLVIDDCNGILYDAGGPDGPYTENNEAFININGTDGDALSLTFTEFDVESHFDDLTIYDGPTTSSPIVDVYTGISLPNDGNPILLSGTSCLLVFTSDFTVNGNGFAVNFECIDFTEPPVAAAGFPGISCTGTVAFSDASTFATSWNWDFGDGNTSTEQNPTYTYTTPGTYDVQLEACNDNGCNTFFAAAAITYDPASDACTNSNSMTFQGMDTTTLCAGVLYDNGGVDGNYAEGSYDQFLIAPPGTTGITITFTSFELGSNGFIGFYQAGDDVFNPLASYTDNNLPNGGQPITFDVSELLILFYSGHDETFPGFELIWEANGSVNPPVADFTASATDVPFGVPVQFTDTSTENPGGWMWGFGDGNTSDKQNPSHVYAQPGTYEVTLTVTNCNGTDTSIPFIITVQEPPSITVDPGSFVVDLEAGTGTTDTLNLCNVGHGDLLATLSTQDGTNQTGYLLDFTTTEAGEGFTWQLFDMDFNVVFESNQTYEANATYSEVIDGLEAGVSYFFVLTDVPDGVLLFEELTLTDLGTGMIFFHNFVQLGPDQFYLLPAPFTGPGMGSAWLSTGANTNPLAADACEAIVVNFDATELIEGVYEGSIIVTTNDPDNPSITIPVTLNVSGTPALSISTNNLDFGEIQVGATSMLSFTLDNTGTAAVEVSGLQSSLAEFGIQSAESITLEPFESQAIEVSFAPSSVDAFADMLALVNNAGDDLLVTLTGTGIAAPSLTVAPTEFVVELIQGQDTTLTVEVGNVGEAVLDFNVNTLSDGTGFIFNFTTDFWGNEFSWNLLDSDNEIVQSSEEGIYESNTDYSVALLGLSEDETYTLQLLDSWGDGALPSYSVVDALSGQVVVEGAFVGNVFEELVSLGAPGSAFADISPTSGSVDPNTNTQLLIDVDATGLSTGTYNLVYELETNDPAQPQATITVTLFVVAPVTADFDAPSFVCGTLPVPFTDASTNVPTSWNWDFGDGTTSTEQNPIHTYAESGTYTITLEACNVLGCDTISLTDFIEVDLDCFAENIPPQHANVVVTECSGSLFDSGGPNAPYLEGSSGSITVAPPGATAISVTFSEFNYQEHADFLYVYDGDLETGTLIGSFTGNELEGQTLTANSGVLTLQEYTDHFVNLSGFAATFNCSNSPAKPPIAWFTLADSVLCANEAAVFTDGSLDFPTTWLWEFGDGGTSTDQNPIYQYSESGTYPVTLTVCNALGCNTLILEITITVDQDCVIDAMPVNGEQSIFGCSGSLYDSGGADDNYVDQNTGVTTIFAPVGTITLEFVSFNYEDDFDGIIIFDGASMEAPVLGFFTGNELPAAITTSGSAVTILEFTDFINNESGFQIDYSCQGGTLGGLTGAQIVVHNEDMCDGIRSFGVNTDAEVDTWDWNFGDGHTSTAANPEHTYLQKGIYPIAVTICADGACETVETMIYSNKLIPEINAPDTVALGQEVQFHGLTPEATHWYWDFGNGETADHATPTTTYSEAGWHDIEVHLTNMTVHETCDANHTHSIFVDATLSSNEVAALLDFSAFPNPTTGQLNLRGLEHLDDGCELRLRSVLGQVLWTAPLAPRVSLARFPSGIYVLEVMEGGRLIGRVKVMKE